MTAAGDSSLARRQFLGAIGAGVASAAVLTQPGEAQESSAPPLKVVDFQNHFVGPSFNLTTMNNTPPAQREAQGRVNALLADPRAAEQQQMVAGGNTLKLLGLG
jgi:hypothetical protein